MIVQIVKPKVLITGASGFIGSHIVSSALERGWDVYAGIRSTSSRSTLSDERLNFFHVDFDRVDELKTDLIDFAKTSGGFQYVIHNAGITKPKDTDEFYRGNALFTQAFAEAIFDSQPGFRKFIFVSSIAALGPGNPVTFDPITESMKPGPITPYGQSKLKAEELLSNIDGLPYVIIRPSAVYGPRDEKMIGRLIGMFKRGIEVRLGPSDQRLSFVHVEDLAVVILDACSINLLGRAFNISDGGIYSQIELYKTIIANLNVQTVAVRIPTWALMTVGYVLFKVLSSFGKQVHLSHYKMRELTAKNWIIDIGNAQRNLNYRPVYNLETGIRQSLIAMHKTPG